MRAPVDVSVQDASGVWTRLPDMGGVRFGTTAPGGCTEATIPLSDAGTLPDLQQGCAVRINDGTTGRTLWTGRLSSPVRQVRGILESGDPSFEGQAGFLADKFTKYTPLVTRLDAWWLGSTMKPFVAGAQVQTGQLPVNESINALQLTLPSGYVVKGYCALASFHGFGYGSAQGVRGIIARHREGAKAANKSKFQVFVWHGQSAGKVRWSSHAVSPSAKVKLSIDPTVASDLTVGFQYNGPNVNTNDENAAVTGDELWSGWWQVQVFRVLKNLDGSHRNGDNLIGQGGLYPHQVVTDVIGEFAASLNLAYDPFVTTVDDSSGVLLTSYDFTDEASLADILTDLCTLVPTHFWWVGPSDTDGEMGVHWSRWSSTQTYLMPPGAVTYDTSAGSEDLANVVNYTYLGSDGVVQRASLAANIWDYPDTYGMNRDAEPLDLTSLHSKAAADQVAAAYLHEVATLPKSAKATVSVDVVDQETGAMIPPWELVAGTRAHVPETGETLRVTECQVDVDTATAELTLGTPRRTTDQIVATLSRHRKRAN